MTFQLLTLVLQDTTGQLQENNKTAIRYDHLAMKLGPDVEESKLSHRLWTLISDAQII